MYKGLVSRRKGTLRIVNANNINKKVSSGLSGDDKEEEKEQQLLKKIDHDIFCREKMAKRFGSVVYTLARNPELKK